MEVYKNEVIIVAINMNLDGYAVEFNINTNKQTWFQVKWHYSALRIVDIDINQDFAILQGRNAHQVIYHSVFNQFQAYVWSTLD